MTQKEIHSESTEVHLDAGAISSLLQQGAAIAPIKHGEGRHPFTIVPDGFKLEYLKQKPTDDLPPLLDHIRQSVTLLSTESFIAYVNLFKGGATRVFATPLDLGAFKLKQQDIAKFTALIDYHAQDERKPRRNAHVAAYPLPLSIELRTWLAVDKEKQGQDAFIQFVEDNQIDIIDPPAASLMEMVLNFESKTAVTFQSNITRVSGGRALVFKEEVSMEQRDRGDAGMEKTIKVPEVLTLKLPIFEGGKEFEIKARLEYRVSSGKLNITFHLQRPQKVLRQAFEQVHKEIEDAELGVGIPILTGEAK